MTRHSPLSTFLIFSIAIIMTGILLVVVMPVDNSPGVLTTTDSFEKEQANLIQHVYQLHERQVSESSTTTAPVQAVIDEGIPRQRAVPVPKPAPAPAPAPANNESIQAYNRKNAQYQPRYMPAPQFDNAYDVWNTTSETTYEPAYSLKNNPWSPDYKPGY